MISGVIEALKALNVKRVAMGTAYTDDINHLEQTYLEQKGYECVSVEGLSLMTDAEMNRVSLTSLLEFADHINRPDAEAIFISCGALRSVEIIREAEKRLGKPFICSNQASMWNCLQSVGIKDQLPGFGQLFSEL